VRKGEYTLARWKKGVINFEPKPSTMSKGTPLSTPIGGEARRSSLLKLSTEGMGGGDGQQGLGVQETRCYRGKGKGFHGGRGKKRVYQSGSKMLLQLKDQNLTDWKEFRNVKNGRREEQIGQKVGPEPAIVTSGGTMQSKNIVGRSRRGRSAENRASPSD